MVIQKYKLNNLKEFQNEVRKIVSNSQVINKVGRVEIKGSHSQKVKLWLRRLGF